MNSKCYKFHAFCFNSVEMELNCDLVAYQDIAVWVVGKIIDILDPLIEI